MKKIFGKSVDVIKLPKYVLAPLQGNRYAQTTGTNEDKNDKKNPFVFGPPKHGNLQPLFYTCSFWQYVSAKSWGQCAAGKPFETK